MTAADIQILGTITSGTAVTNIHTTNDRTVGLGTDSEQMDIEANEVQRLTSTGLVVGKSSGNSNIKVVGVTAANSNGITGVVTLIATDDDRAVSFESAASTFGMPSSLVKYHRKDNNAQNVNAVHYDVWEPNGLK